MSTTNLYVGYLELVLNRDIGIIVKYSFKWLVCDEEMIVFTVTVINVNEFIFRNFSIAYYNFRMLQI